MLTVLSYDFEEVKDAQKEIRTRVLEILQAAAGNFRFTFEMKPSQVALAATRIAIKELSEKEKGLLTPGLVASLKS